MRILYWIPRYDAGLMGNQIHVEVIEAWREMGVDAEVLTFSASRKQRVTEAIDGIVVHRLPLNRTLLEKALNRAAQPVMQYPYWVGALAHYRRFIAEQGRRFDLLHIETAFPLGALAALTPGPQPPQAVTLQGADVMAEPAFDYGYARFRAIRALLRRVFQKAAVIRADSPMIERMVLGMGAQPARTVAIPFNITNADFPPANVPPTTFRAQARQEICQRHGLDPDRPLLISISRLHPFKGVEFLVEAIPALQAAVGPVQVILGGPSRTTPRFGDYGAYLKRRAQELGVAEATHLIGRVEHSAIQRYWAAADIVVVPSVVESLNRVAAEAGAVGTPTIVTRTTGISEYVTARDCGQIVEPRSGQSIAAAATQLLTDRELWARQSANGPWLAADFRPAVIARQLLDAYVKALSPAPSPGPKGTPGRKGE
ncbi:MAG TPA: glycosyltransferase family 4 protein [Herpetosiphonaceae bacterium]